MTSSDRWELRLSPMITFLPSRAFRCGSANFSNQSGKHCMSNQPDGLLLYLAPLGPPTVHVSYICCALYTAYGGRTCPSAQAAYITDTADFELFITLSGYLHPFSVMTFALPGSSARFVSSKFMMFDSGTSLRTSVMLSKNVLMVFRDT